MIKKTRLASECAKLDKQKKENGPILVGADMDEWLAEEFETINGLDEIVGR